MNLHYSSFDASSGAYLLAALSGEVRDLIAGFTVGDDVYPEAWKALTDFYKEKLSMVMFTGGQGRLFY